MAAAIEVENLSKKYGHVLAVDNISLSIEQGELVGFLGKNGAGKTTTMRILSTFIQADKGVARICGFDTMYQSMAVRRSLGYLQEGVPLYAEMRVEEYLKYRAQLKNVTRADRASRLAYCLDLCRIKEVRRRLIGSLSKGYRQRVGLADTLLNDPPVLILDEPLSGLDPIQQEETLTTIRGLGGKHTVMFSSHHLTDVEKICDRAIIINQGRIRFDNRLSEFKPEQSHHLLLEVRGAQESVSTFLRAFPGVKECHVTASDHQHHSHRYEVVSEPGQDLREKLATAIIEKQWGLRQISTHQVSLGELFYRMSME